MSRISCCNVIVVIQEKEAREVSLGHVNETSMGIRASYGLITERLSLKPYCSYEGTRWPAQILDVRIRVRSNLAQNDKWKCRESANEIVVFRKRERIVSFRTCE